MADRDDGRMDDVAHDPAGRAALIATYRGGHDDVVSALVEVGRDALDRQPADGGWSARQIVHHLADSETTSGIRLRRLLAEDAPVIAGYDEEAFARRLHYDRPIETSLALFKAVREASAELLDRLSDDDWARAGTHSESGRYSVDDWLRIYAAHGRDHADQIRRTAT
jgi:hypothetical protein